MCRAGKYLFIGLLAAIISACSHPGYRQFGGYAQGGVWSVKADLTGVKDKPAEIQARIEEILFEIDTTLSGYNAASQLSRFNAGERIWPSDMFCDIYTAAYWFWRNSDGALDCAAGPLFDIWGFGFRNDSLPSAALVRETLASCGMARLRPDIRAAIAEDGSLCGKDLLQPGINGPLPRLNYNAIAQGYSCDLVAEYLHSIGIHNMLVDIGEIFCEGVNPSGRPWRVGVDRPEDGNNTPGASIEAIWQNDGLACGIVTSGNYRKFYTSEGRKYAHTIDPRTGMPVESDILSATIVTPTAMEADAWATISMVIGLDAAQDIVMTSCDMEAFFVWADPSDGTFRHWASPGLGLVQAND